MPRSPRIPFLVRALLATGALAGCGGDEPERAASPPTSAEPASSPTSASPAPAARGGERSVVAEATGARIEVFAGEDEPSPERVLLTGDEPGGRLVFLVRGPVEGDRLLVDLPVRPNGTTGWVRRGDVALSAHAYRLEVRLGDHRLTVHHDGEVVFEAPIGVGVADTPTPGGTYYLKELLRPPTPDGPYGPYAYGLSGFSNELETFAGGDGVIGIHGTDDPATVGTDVSHGCIRLRNADVVHLVEEIGLPLGTPVDILP